MPPPSSTHFWTAAFSPALNVQPLTLATSRMSYFARNAASTAAGLVGMLVATAVPSLFVLSQVVNAVVSGSVAAEVSVPSMANCRQVHLPAASQTLLRIGTSRVSFGSAPVLAPVPVSMLLPLPPLPVIGPLPPPARTKVDVSDEPALQARVNAKLEASTKDGKRQRVMRTLS